VEPRQAQPNVRATHVLKALDFESRNVHDQRKSCC
jgi:hypothetical protein